MKALLDAMAGVKVFAMDDMNAMHFAAQKGHAEVVRLLLNNGERSQICAACCLHDSSLGMGLACLASTCCCAAVLVS